MFLLRPLAPAAACLLLAAASPSGAACIRGTVRVPASPHADPAFQPYAGQASSMPAHAMPTLGVVSDAVVYVESLPAAADSALPMSASRPKLAQKDQSFVPRVIVVPVGGSVDFPNLDPIYHNVFSVSPPKRFDLGKYPRGQSRTVRFTKPGLVNVFCDIHSNMAAFILVVPSRAFAQARTDGSFRLPDLPPGRYALAWWHPDFRGGRREIELGADDSVVDVSF